MAFIETMDILRAMENEHPAVPAARKYGTGRGVSSTGRFHPRPKGIKRLEKDDAYRGMRRTPKG